MTADDVNLALSSISGLLILAAAVLASWALNFARHK